MSFLLFFSSPPLCKHFIICLLSSYDRTNLANSDSKWASRSWPPFEVPLPPPRPAKAEKGWGWDTVGWCPPRPIWPRFRANPGGGVLDITGEGWPQWPPSCGGGCWPAPPRPRPVSPGISPALLPPFKALKRPPADWSPVNWSKLLLSHPGGESARRPALCERLSATWPVTIAGSRVVQSLACGDLTLFQPENLK